MPVLAEGSTKNVPAHIEDTTPCMAEIAAILNDPGVCRVWGFSPVGCTTLTKEDGSFSCECLNSLNMFSSPRKFELSASQIRHLLLHVWARTRVQSSHRVRAHLRRPRTSLSGIRDAKVC